MGDWITVTPRNRHSEEDARAAELATRILNDEATEAHRQRIRTRCRMHLRETGYWPGQGMIDRWAREEFQPVLDAARRGG